MLRHILVILAFASVACAQSISASPSSLNFTAPYNPIAIALTGSSTGVTVTTTQAWLSVNITNSPSLPSALFARVDTTSLAAGTHSAFISIFPSNPTVAPVSIPVTVFIPTTPSLSGNALEFTSVDGGPVAQQFLTLSAPTGLPYTITSVYLTGDGWLTFTPDTGTTSAATQISVRPIPSLGPGGYSAYLRIAVGNRTPLIIMVRFRITQSGTLPQVTVSPGVLRFPSVTEQNLTIAPSVPTSYAISISQLSGTGAGSWLGLPYPSGVANSASLVPVVVDQSVVSQMPTGTYYSLLSVAIPGQFPQFALAVLEVLASGGATTTPASLTFNFNPPTPAPNQLVRLASPTLVTVSLAASSTGNWLSVGPTITQLVPSVGGFETVISVGLGSPSFSLSPGTYSGTVNITQVGTSTVLATIPVTLNVGGQAPKRATPSQVTFNYQYGQPDPPPQTLAASPALPFTVQVSNGGYWLQATPNNTATEFTLSARNAGTLGTGVYTAEVRLTFSDGETLTVPVTLNVSQTAQLRANTNFLTFTGSGTQTLDLTSTDGMVSFTTAVKTDSGGNWLSADPPFALAPRRTSISVNASGLAPGFYTGMVTFEYPGGSLPVPVRLTVSQ